jgi:hypothetical protein
LEYVSSRYFDLWTNQPEGYRQIKIRLLGQRTFCAAAISALAASVMFCLPSLGNGFAAGLLVGLPSIRAFASVKPLNLGVDCLDDLVPVHGPDYSQPNTPRANAVRSDAFLQ